jgi:3D (Asp-Asp-Asp) domain-containing protein
MTPEKEKQIEEQKKKEKWITVIATAYSASANECGNDLGITASGTKANTERGTIACPENIPFGTKLYIPELNKTYICEDRGNPRYIKWVGNTMKIDIFMDSKQAALLFGVRKFKAKLILK